MNFNDHLNLSIIITNVVSFLAKAFNKASRVLSEIGGRFVTENIQKRMVAGSTSYDMLRAPDEPYYADQYWSVIEPALQSLPQDLRCLDLGCSQGRFSLRLAQYFPAGKIVACDLSSPAIDSAKAEAKSRNLSNIEFHCRGIADQMLECKDSGFNIIIMTEVTFFYPDWVSHFSDIIKKLCKGGVLVVSFRSQYFDALYLVRNKSFDYIDMLLNYRRGRIFSPSLMEFSWQTSAEIINLFRENGLDMLALQGVGVCSGLPGDPHDFIARPSLLDNTQKSELMKLELEIGKSVPDAGRYILAVGKK